MAFMDHTYANSDSVVERALAASASFFASAAQRHARMRIYRETLAELDALSVREMDDLGITRADVSDIAWQAAVDKTTR